MFKNKIWRYSLSSDEQEGRLSSRRYLVILLLTGLLVVLGVTLHLTVSSVTARSNLNQYVYMPVTASGYFEGSHLDGIAGRVFANGKPAANIKLDLRHSDGTGWEIVKSTKTSNAGYYFFKDIDSLGKGEEYYVGFGRNESNPEYVYFWYGPIINSFTKGDIVFGGSFDITDVPLKSPKSGAVETLPINFRWEKRGIPGDSYRLVIIDYNEDVFWRTFDLGDVDSFTLTGLAPDMVFGKQYSWYIEVYTGPDSFGESYMLNDIKFLRPITQGKSISENVFTRGFERGGR